MAIRLTQSEIRDLRLLAFFGERGFWAPRPGSNAMALLQAETPLGAVDGEVLEALFRVGALNAVPGKAVRTVSADMDGERLDIDMDFRWTVSPAGRAALDQPAREGEDDAGH